MKNEKTKITFEYDGDEYTLEYTADSLKKMQDRGFNFNDMNSRLLTAPEELFDGAFIANHKNVSRKKREEIFRELVGENEDGEDLFEVLAEMVNEAIDEIMNPHKGNVKWVVQR